MFESFAEFDAMIDGSASEEAGASCSHSLCCTAPYSVHCCTAPYSVHCAALHLTVLQHT